MFRSERSVPWAGSRHQDRFVRDREIRRWGTSIGRRYVAIQIRSHLTFQLSRTSWWIHEESFQTSQQGCHPIAKSTVKLWDWQLWSLWRDISSGAAIGSLPDAWKEKKGKAWGFSWWSTGRTIRQHTHPKYQLVKSARNSNVWRIPVEKLVCKFKLIKLI